MVEECTGIGSSTSNRQIPSELRRTKLRYRSPAIGALVAEAPHGFSLELAEPAYGVASGQAAVLYEDEAIVGAGLIRS